MAEEKKKDEEKKDEKSTPKDNIVTTKHSVKIGGKALKYRSEERRVGKEC